MPNSTPTLLEPEVLLMVTLKNLILPLIACLASPEEGAPEKATVLAPLPFIQVPLFVNVIEEPDADLVIVRVVELAALEVKVLVAFMVKEETVAF
jgi:hypothetical protein